MVGNLDKANYYLFRIAIGIISVVFLIGRWDPLPRLGVPDLLIFEIRFLLLTGALIIVFVILLQLRKVRGYDSSVLFGFITLFFGYMLLTPLWSPEPSLVFYKIYELASIWLVLFLVYNLFSIGDFRENFWDYTVIITGLLALIGFIEIIFLGGSGRLAVLGGGPIIYARFMGVLCIISLYRVFETEKYLKWLPPAVIALILLFLTGARGPFLANFITIFLLLFFWRRKWKFNLKFYALGLISIIIISFSPFWNQLISFIQNRIIALTFIQRHTAGRTSLYAGAWEAIRENPIFGFGLDYFQTLNIRDHTYPHNLLLEIGVEGGVIGLTLFFLVLGWALITFFKKRNEIDVLSCCLFIFFLINSQFSGDIYDNRGVFLFLLFLSFPLMKEGKLKKQK